MYIFITILYFDFNILYFIAFVTSIKINNYLYVYQEIFNL